jgi:Flp pilus assembly protein TadD
MPPTDPRIPSLRKPAVSLQMALGLALGLITLIVYWQASRHGFILYDDDQYLYENLIVRAGLTLSGVKWAFTTFFMGNWHPVTWLSHMLDVQLFGLHAGAHHLVNVAFHVANSLLLFIIFAKTTGKLWRSALIAAIFALHPLHVESVAWIAERKDVLSTFFAMLMILRYIQYTEEPIRWKYISTGLLFTLGLMSKPMLVTLPCILLLLDFWPLRRIQGPLSWQATKHLFVEKIPFFALVIALSVLTIFAQRDAGAIHSLDQFPFYVRLSNTLLAYIGYLGKIVWPANLALLYSFNHVIRMEYVLGSLALLIIVTLVCLKRMRHRYLLVGWLWFLGMLVPVIGLLQTGEQSMADRYTYMPLIGISMMLVWAIADILEERHLPATGRVLGTAVVILLAGLTHHQLKYWKDSRTLFEHTLAVTQGNSYIHNNLGLVLASEGKTDAAMAHYEKAITLGPYNAEAHANLGYELLKQRKFNESRSHLMKAVQIEPNLFLAQAGLGAVLGAMGDLEQARLHLTQALRLWPESPECQNNLCYVLQQLKRPEEAAPHCAEAARLKS